MLVPRFLESIPISGPKGFVHHSSVLEDVIRSQLCSIRIATLSSLSGYWFMTVRVPRPISCCVQTSAALIPVERRKRYMMVVFQYILSFGSGDLLAYDN